MMQHGKRQRCFAVLVIGALLLAPVMAFSTDAQTSWKTECVGRYQLAVPSEVEVALTISEKLTTDIASDTIKFKDGTPASRSHFDGLDVVSIQAEGDFATIKKRVDERVLAYKQELLESDATREDGLSIKPWAAKVDKAFGWINKNNATLYLHRISHLFRSSMPQDEISSFLAAFRSRTLYEIPKGEGICIPYGFIADDGKAGRQVGVTMRLKAHPEVEIFFEDRSAADYGIKQTTRTQERTEISMLWQQQAHSSKKIDLAFPGYNAIKLDGRDGTASFVEITRKDGSSDYGFAAVVNGDHTAKTDAPQLMLYVIRTASRAKGKPVSKNELKDMANKIAASIKRREVE